MLDAPATFFLICFLFGIALSALSLLTGFAHLPLGGHGVHLSHAFHLHAPAHSDTHESGSPLNLGSLLAFLVWFGGIGFLLHALSPLALLLVLLFSVMAGIAGATVIAFFLVKVLIPAQTEVDPAQYRLEGTAGSITAAIPAGGTGEITYSKVGTRRSDAARSIDGNAIPHGEEVVIMGYKRGIAYVQPLEKYLSSSASAIAGLLAALEDEKHVSGRDRMRDSEPRA
jgi:membrane protein implicated in regulation of membrane protease activity